MGGLLFWKINIQVFLAFRKFFHFDFYFSVEPPVNILQAHMSQLVQQSSFALICEHSWKKQFLIILSKHAIRKSKDDTQNQNMNTVDFFCCQLICKMTNTQFSFSTPQIHSEVQRGKKT